MNGQVLSSNGGFTVGLTHSAPAASVPLDSRAKAAATRVGNTPVTARWNARPMVNLFEGYGSATMKRRGASPWDEMFPAIGDGESVREAYTDIHSALARMTQEELRGRTESLASSYLAQGVTFDFAGEERPFPLDAVPRVIDGADWTVVEKGVQQRVRALEAFLADAYGAQAAVRDGVIPAALISSSTHFHRQAAGIVAANGVRIQVSGIDLIRDENGAWRVLEDNVRVPSGVSYVISNRRVMAQTLPELFSSMHVRPVGDYPNRLLSALRASAPGGSRRSRRSWCSPPASTTRRTSSTPCSPASWASSSSRAATCSAPAGASGCARRRAPPASTSSTAGSTTSSSTRSSSTPTPCSARPGILLAARLGNVTIANAVGNGVADDKLVYTYVPDLIRYYLSRGARAPERRHLAPRGSRSARGGARPPRRTRRQARRRLGRQGPRRGTGCEPRRTRHPALAVDRRPARLDRPARRAALDHPHARRRRHAAAPRRPAAVRRQRRRERVGAARRPHPRRASRGSARGQLVAGRRLEGHLGDRSHRSASGDGCREPGVRSGRAAERPGHLRIDAGRSHLPAGQRLGAPAAGAAAAAGQLRARRGKPSEASRGPKRSPRRSVDAALRPQEAPTC